MIDKKDTRTLDAFPAKRKVGRPATSSAEKRREDNHLRVIRHRKKKKAEARIMAHIMDRLTDPAFSQHRGSWVELLAFVTGKGDNIDGYRVEYLSSDGKEGSKHTDLASICDLISEGCRITKLV